MREALAFDDVLLVPVYSEVRSRLDVDTSTNIAGIKLKIPIISSPMDTVSEAEMAIALGNMGGMGILHRFLELKEQIDMSKDVWWGGVPLIPSIGVNDSEKKRFEVLYEHLKEFKIDIISIDIANGHHILMKEMVKFVQSIDPQLPILAGNVATYDGAMFMADLGIQAIRVGIGSGAACSTRIQTGCGVPLLTSLLDCAEIKKQYHVSILADGGILYPADLVKSLAAGADAIICGTILAGTKEAPGGIIYTNDKKAWKAYRGMASHALQEDKRGGLKPGTVAEGVSQLVEYKGSLERVIAEFVGGLRSGMSYLNARTIPELRKAEMVRVTNAGLLESHAQGTRRR